MSPVLTLLSSPPIPYPHLSSVLVPSPTSTSLAHLRTLTPQLALTTSHTPSTNHDHHLVRRHACSSCPERVLLTTRRDEEDAQDCRADSPGVQLVLVCRQLQRACTLKRPSLAGEALKCRTDRSHRPTSSSYARSAPPASAPAPRATAARTRTRRAAAARPRMPRGTCCLPLDGRATREAERLVHTARTSARARRRPTATAATTASATAVARRAPPSDYAPGAVRSTRGPRIQDSLEWGCGVPTMGCVVLEGARVNCPRSLLVDVVTRPGKERQG